MHITLFCDYLYDTPARRRSAPNGGSARAHTGLYPSLSVMVLRRSWSSESLLEGYGGRGASMLQPARRPTLSACPIQVAICQLMRNEQAAWVVRGGGWASPSPFAGECRGRDRSYARTVPFGLTLDCYEAFARGPAAVDVSLRR